MQTAISSDKDKDDDMDDIADSTDDLDELDDVLEPSSNENHHQAKFLANSNSKMHSNGNNSSLIHDFKNKHCVASLVNIYDTDNIRSSIVTPVSNGRIETDAFPEDDKRKRRAIANSNERRRMQSINAGFQNLKSLIPHSSGEKLSKVCKNQF